MGTDRISSLLEILRARGPQGSVGLQRALGVSQPTLSRLVRAAGAAVVRIGRARSTRYAAVRELRTFGNRWPVHRVSAKGRLVEVASLHALHPRGWWWDAPSRSEWLVGEFAGGLLPDLPWFLDDLRPQGFLGKAFARRVGGPLGLPADPQDWDADAVLTALLAFGDDLPGDFVIGDAAAERVQRAALHEPATIPADDRRERYGALAAQALAGEVAGSSAGGEQPKFATCVRAPDGSVRHGLVKFSPPLDGPSGRRWADLLRCEHLAAETLRQAGVAVSATEWVESPTRAFLDVTRFDRIGAHGRRGVVSLKAVEAAHHGGLDSWAAAADRLERDGWLTAADAERLRVLWWFGRLIGNTDMHFANVSLLLDHARPLALAPVYDMLPMHYRPNTTGEIVDRPFDVALAAPRQEASWNRAAEMAVAFWERVTIDHEVSSAFRATVAGHAQAVRVVADRFGGG